jgi:hypothetical protein
LLETIEAFATSGLTTRRSILFAFWDGEELDLNGSRYWLRHPTVPADRLKLAIMADMVGRLRDGQLYVLGARSGYGMRRLFSGPVADPLWLDFDWEVSANSDHWSFIEKRVPVVLLHTGLHRDYHRPSDDSEKVNRDGMRDIARYLLGVLVKAGNEDQLPAYRDRVRRETDDTQQDVERPLPRLSVRNWPSDRPRPRLGITWRDDEAEPGVIFLTRVIEGSPADAAGLEVHDRIYQVNGQPFENESAFRTTITTATQPPAAEVELLIERNGRVRMVKVALPEA